MPITRLMPAAEFAVPVPALSAPGGAASDDGRALHELLFAGGDIARPRPWCAEPTGWLVAASVEVVEGLVATAAPGEVIRILDYGAGTGLAAIELIKALSERQLPTGLPPAASVLNCTWSTCPATGSPSGGSCWSPTRGSRRTTCSPKAARSASSRTCWAGSRLTSPSPAWSSTSYPCGRCRGCAQG